LLQLPEIHGDVHCFGSVEPESMVDIWEPGRYEYDHDHRVPRSYTALRVLQALV
jgi:hypothetical protein